MCEVHSGQHSDLNEIRGNTCYYTLRQNEGPFFASLDSPHNIRAERKKGGKTTENESAFEIENLGAATQTYVLRRKPNLGTLLLIRSLSPCYLALASQYLTRSYQSGETMNSCNLYLTGNCRPE